MRLANCQEVRARIWTQAGWLRICAVNSHQGPSFLALMLRGSVDTVILFPCSLFEVRFGAESALQKHRPFRAWLPQSLLGLHHPLPQKYTGLQRQEGPWLLGDVGVEVWKSSL